MELLIRKYLDGKLKKREDIYQAFELAQEELGMAEEQGNKPRIKLYLNICQELSGMVDEFENFGEPIWKD